MWYLPRSTAHSKQGSAAVRLFQVSLARTEHCTGNLLSDCARSVWFRRLSASHYCCVGPSVKGPRLVSPKYKTRTSLETYRAQHGKISYHILCLMHKQWIDVIVTFLVKATWATLPGVYLTNANLHYFGQIS